MSDKTDVKEGEPLVLSLNPEGSSADVPAVVGEAPSRDGGLTYENAYEDEREQMDAVIAGIDLTDPNTITSIGGEERQQLADLADKLLDSFQPSLKLAFAEAFKALIDGLTENSLDKVKQRSTLGLFKKAFKILGCILRGKDYRVELGKNLIENFMNDVTGSRASIQEVSDKLAEQQGELKKNWNRINDLGAGMVKAAQRMRITRAAVDKYIKDTEAGTITQLADLREKAATSGRTDDRDAQQLADALFGNLKVIDGDLLGSISVYDMNVANLAFTRQANIDNRIKTDTALTSSVAEWKSQLAMFGTVLTERTAQTLLANVKLLSDRAVAANKDLFDELVEAHVEGAASGMYNLKSIAEKQDAMAATLESIGPRVEEQFNELARDKEVLIAAAAEFRKRATTAFVTPDATSSAPQPAPGA